MLLTLIQRKNFYRFLTVCLFVCCFSTGVWLSSRKPLWTDEIHTQEQSIDRFSYREILTGRLPEGNLAPLFYLFQETISNLNHYKLPWSWQNYQWNFNDQWSQVLLRLIPNLFMSLSLVMIFYFFARYYSLFWGAYAFLVSLSSFVMWVYWVEARPYALWFFLTTAQLLIFIRLTVDESKVNLWRLLVVINILLSLTIMFSVAQIVVVALSLALCTKSVRSKWYVVWSVFPVVLSLFYYFKSRAIYVWLHNPLTDVYQAVSNAVNPSEVRAGSLDFRWDLMDRAFAHEWMLILVFYLILWLVVRIQQRFNILPSFNACLLTETKKYVLMTGGMIFSAVLILAIFQMWVMQAKGDFSVSERYLIYLAPLGIIGVTMMSADVARTFRRNYWMMTNLWILLGGFLILRLLKVYTDMSLLGLYW